MNKLVDFFMLVGYLGGAAAVVLTISIAIALALGRNDD